MRCENLDVDAPRPKRPRSLKGDAYLIGAGESHLHASQSQEEVGRQEIDEPIATGTIASQRRARAMGTRPRSLPRGRLHGG